MVRGWLGFSNSGWSNWQMPSHSTDVRRLPAARCHELSGGLDGQLAVDLVHPKRLVFRPDHDPVPTKPDGGLDWTRVTRVLVTEVVDYHGR